MGDNRARLGGLAHLGPGAAQSAARARVRPRLAAAAHPLLLSAPVRARVCRRARARPPGWPVVALRSPTWPSPSVSAPRASSSGPVTACCGTTARSACASSPAPTRRGAARSRGRSSRPPCSSTTDRLQGRVCSPLAQLDDSKTRTLAQREELYDAVLACATRVSVIVAPAREVDRRGVHRANLAALARALRRARRARRMRCSCPTASACRSSASTAPSSAATARAPPSRRPRSSPRSRATASCAACTPPTPTTASTGTSATRRRSTARRS